MRAYRVEGPHTAAQFVTVEARAKQLARDCNGNAKPVEVPTVKAELIPFLNELAADQYRRQPGLEIEISEDPQLSGQPAAEGAVISEADVEKVNASRPAFLGKLTAEEIERHRVQLGQCPKCGNRPDYLRRVEETNIEHWLETAELEAIKRIIEYAREVVRERGAVLEGEGSVQ